MKKIILNEVCKKCAECCKNYPFIELSKDEINILEISTELQSDIFTNKKEEASEEYFLQFQENGDCYFLNKNNGNYFCGVYESRPEICKKYPAGPQQEIACAANKRRVI